MPHRPFVPPDTSHVVDFWTMSQRTGSIAYLTFSGGLFAGGLRAVRPLCDRWGWQFILFRIFGQNALAAYIIHPIVAGAVKPYLPNDSPAWYLAAGFSLYFGSARCLNRYLEKHELFLRL